MAKTKKFNIYDGSNKIIGTFVCEELGKTKGMKCKPIKYKSLKHKSLKHKTIKCKLRK